MGEAKRRQKLDPTYGKFMPTVGIKESIKSNNFLVMVGGHVADSTIHYEEALAIQQWIEIELCRRPIRKTQCTWDGVAKWVLASDRLAEYPESTAEMRAYDLQSGKRVTTTMTVTADNLLKEFHY